jgi:transcription initiation factor IIE alpha subunit
VAAKKVTTAAKKVVKKTSPKKKKKVEVGSLYECSVCGLEVSVEKACDCGDTCDLMCCGEYMEII